MDFTTHSKSNLVALFLFWATWMGVAKFDLLEDAADEEGLRVYDSV